MNVKTVVVIALACGLASLSGCASMKGDSRSLASTTQRTQDLDDIDQVYVARIEEQAKQHFMELRWVHPPRISDR